MLRDINSHFSYVLRYLFTFSFCLQVHAPCVKPTLLRTDSDELKDFISKPALKYILRFLTGLATDHEPTQASSIFYFHKSVILILVINYSVSLCKWIYIELHRLAIIYIRQDI